MNKVILKGNVGKDAELRTFESGQSIATTTLATTERWRDKNTGEKREASEWHNLVFGDNYAKIAAHYIKKGSQILVEGKIVQRSWEADGVKKYMTEIRVSSFEFCGTPPDTNKQQPSNNSSNNSSSISTPTYNNNGEQVQESDLPF